MAPVTTVANELELVRTGATDHGRGTGGRGNGHPSGGGPGGDNGAAPYFGSADVPQRAYVTGIAVALAAILMFFMALVSAYMVRKGFPNSGWQALQPPRILWLNTLILLASSATIVVARRRLADHDESGFRYWWMLTTALGIIFLGGQLLAWRQLAHAGVYLDSNPSSSFFYVFTAAHGLHLLGGLMALIAVAVRNPRHLTRGTAAEVTAIYWHFMDGLWVFLFLLLFLGR
jgi:cytochrome c oxidase subunit 3